MENTELLKQLTEETKGLFPRGFMYLYNVYLIVYQIKKLNIDRKKAIKNTYPFLHHEDETTIISYCTRGNLKNILFDTISDFEHAVNNNTLLSNENFLKGLNDAQISAFSKLFSEDTTPKSAISIAEDDDELSFPEGKEKYRLHRSQERNAELIKQAKAKRLETDEKLHCEVCSFSFIDKYGPLGEGFIEAHHLFPISKLKEETETKIEDIALVCSNCHRMLHRKRPWLETLEKLKTMLQVDEEQ